MKQPRKAGVTRNVLSRCRAIARQVKRRAFIPGMMFPMSAILCLSACSPKVKHPDNRSFEEIVADDPTMQRKMEEERIAAALQQTLIYRNAITKLLSVGAVVKKTHYPDQSQTAQGLSELEAYISPCPQDFVAAYREYIEALRDWGNAKRALDAFLRPENMKTVWFEELVNQVLHVSKTSPVDDAEKTQTRLTEANNSAILRANRTWLEVVRIARTYGATLPS